MVINKDCTTNRDGRGISLQLLRDACAKVLAKEQLGSTVAPGTSRNKCLSLPGPCALTLNIIKTTIYPGRIMIL